MLGYQRPHSHRPLRLFDQVSRPIQQSLRKRREHLFSSELERHRHVCCSSRRAQHHFHRNQPARFEGANIIRDLECNHIGRVRSQCRREFPHLGILGATRRTTRNYDLAKASLTYFRRQRIIAIYSTTTFPNPTYAMLQSVIQADLAFSFIGMIAILARCILHLLVQSGRLQLYRPGHAPIQPDVESGNQAQPLSNLSAIHVLPERPLRPSRPPRARLTGSTIGLPRYATEPRDDPPPPYVAVSKEPPESSSMPV